MAIYLVNVPPHAVDGDGFSRVAGAPDRRFSDGEAPSFEPPFDRIGGPASPGPAAPASPPSPLLPAAGALLVDGRALEVWFGSLNATARVSSVLVPAATEVRAGSGRSGTAGTVAAGRG